MVALSFGVAACSDDLPPETSRDEIEVITYNLANSLGTSAGAEMTGYIASIAPDFAALQEANLSEGLEAATGMLLAMEPASGVGLLYDAGKWSLVSSDCITLGDNDDGWGKRVAQIGVFADSAGRGVVVTSTHWCVSIRSDDDTCDAQRHVAYAESLLGELTHPLGHIIAGDFNVFDGFAGSPAVARIRQDYVDTFGELNPNTDAITFQGNGWAPPGRIDYIFAGEGVTVLDSQIDDSELASDHYPQRARVRW